MITVGRNRRFLWMKKKGEKAKIVLEFEGYRSYAQKAVINLLRYYANIDGLEVGKRQAIVLPEDELGKAIDLMETIRRLDLAQFKKFREEFSRIQAQDPREYLGALEEIVKRYATIRVLQRLLK